MPDMSNLLMLSENFPLILNAIDDAVIITDNNQAIIFWNRSASSMFDYSREEVLEKKLPDLNLFLLPGGEKVMPNSSPGHLSGQKNTDGAQNPDNYLNRGEIETEIMQKDGTRVDIAYTVSPVSNRNKNRIGTLIIARDITRQKRTIADQEKMIKLMVGRELKMMALKEEIKELQSELSYYLPIRKHDGSESSQNSENIKSEIIQKGEDDGGILARVFARIGYFVKKNRSKIKIREEQQEAILNVLEDVEEEKNRSESLAKDLEKFRLAVENSSDHIVITSPDGTILFANNAVEKITGFSAKEIIGRKAGSGDLWGGTMGAKFYEKLWSEIKINRKTFLGEFGNHRKNGEKYTAYASIYPVLDKNKTVQFFVDIERDITHEKEVDRMKNEFISLASHQLRTPLSAMKWFSEILLHGDVGQLSGEQQEMVNNIYQSNERMIQLVNSLLNISRIESGRIIIDPVPTDLGGLVNEVVKELKNKIDAKKQKLVINIDNDLPKINLDPKLIGEVYKNLLTNAVKYSPEGGEIKVNIIRRGEEIISEVTDTGYGIPLTEQNKIFKKFFRGTNIVKIETDGTGLGLYLTKAIIDSSGGKIWFESRQGGGSTFKFSLNLAGVAPKKGEVSLTPEIV